MFDILIHYLSNYLVFLEDKFLKDRYRFLMIICTTLVHVAFGQCAHIVRGPVLLICSVISMEFSRATTNRTARNFGIVLINSYDS